MVRLLTGAKVPTPTNTAAPAPDQAPLTLSMKPELNKLPVFAHGGSIIPVEPLVQSTNQTPQGPLTLKVYAGDNCGGSIYQDDGRTFDYQRGAYLRIKFTCKVTPNSFEISATPQQGSYPAWWKNIRIEAYGWKPWAKTVMLDGKALKSATTAIGRGFAVTIPASTQGFTLELRSSSHKP